MPRRWSSCSRAGFRPAVATIGGARSASLPRTQHRRACRNTVTSWKQRRSRRGDPADLFVRPGGCGGDDPLQCVELVRRAGVSKPRGDAHLAGDQTQECHLCEHLARAAHAADRGGARLYPLRNGHFVSIPALASMRSDAPALVTAIGSGSDRLLDAHFEPAERELLIAHRDHGCHSLWCVAGERAHPFVFMPRLVKGIVPCAQLIYCREIGDFVRFASAWPLSRQAISGRSSSSIRTARYRDWLENSSTASRRNISRVPISRALATWPTPKP